LVRCFQASLFLHISCARSYCTWRASCVVAKHQSAPVFAGSSWVHEPRVGVASLDDERWNLASSGMCRHWVFGSLGHLATSGIWKHRQCGGRVGPRPGKCLVHLSRDPEGWRANFHFLPALQYDARRVSLPLARLSVDVELCVLHAERGVKPNALLPW